MQEQQQRTWNWHQPVPERWFVWMWPHAYAYEKPGRPYPASPVGVKQHHAAGDPNCTHRTFHRKGSLHILPSGFQGGWVRERINELVAMMYVYC